MRRIGGGGEVGRQRTHVDGEEGGGSGREREDEEAYLHWNGGDREEAIYDGGVAIDSEVEGGANGGRRGRDGDATVDDVVDNLGAGWVE